MANTGGISITGLSTPSKWVHSFLVEVYEDEGMTTLVARSQPIHKWDDATLANVQQEIKYMGGLTWGQVYYVRVGAVTPVTGTTAWSSLIPVTAGDQTQGGATGTGPSSQTAPAGYYFNSYDSTTGLFGSGSPSISVSLYEKFAMTWNGVTTADVCLLRQKISPNPLQIPANFAHSNFFAETAATGSTVFSVKHALAASPTSFSTIATITFSASGTVGAFSTQAAVDLAVGDIIKVVGPASPDSTLADIGGEIFCSRNASEAGGPTSDTIADGGVITPGSATTLTGETAHNTSAFDDYNDTSAVAEVQDNFTGSYMKDSQTVSKNDDIYDDSLNIVTPANISKVDISTLLYAGSTTRIIAHYMPWFADPKSGSPGHINVGYDSDDQTQVDNQIADMVSRGIHVVNPDWYGQSGQSWSSSSSSHHNAVTLKVKTACESDGTINFFICVDIGAIQNASGVTNRTNALISEINYILANYATSARYEKVGGVPLINFFGIEDATVNWDDVVAGLTGSVKLIFMNSGGVPATYASGNSAGAFGWPQPNIDTPSDPVTRDIYLDPLYDAFNANPAQIAMAVAFPGFNGTLSTWSQNKHLGQRDGQTWLDTFTEINEHFSSGNQLDYLMIATWNDWEEGSAIEPGIENNVSLSASVSGSVLSWQTTGGQPATLAFYTVMYGTDGTNFTILNTYPTTTTSLNLTTAMASLPANTYKIRVKAYGKPCIVNNMSNEVIWIKT
jgi:hypothetical protein